MYWLKLVKFPQIGTQPLSKSSLNTTQRFLLDYKGILIDILLWERITQQRKKEWYNGLFLFSSHLFRMKKLFFTSAAP